MIWLNKGHQRNPWIFLLLIPLMHDLGFLIQIESSPQSLHLFSQQCQTKTIKGSRNLDLWHPEGRFAYLGLLSCKERWHKTTYLPGKKLQKGSPELADNLYLCYSWHHCILRMKVSVKMRPQLWRRSNRHHRVIFTFVYHATLTILKWQFRWINCSNGLVKLTLALGWRTVSLSLTNERSEYDCYSKILIPLQYLQWHRVAGLVAWVCKSKSNWKVLSHLS